MRKFPKIAQVSRFEIELARFSGDNLQKLSSWSLYGPRPAFCSSFLSIKLMNGRSNGGHDSDQADE
jgi:hypothetical protein